LAFVSVALAAALCTIPVAHADTFDFSYTAPFGVSGSGTLDGTFEGIINGNQAWLITSGDGVFDDGIHSSPITLVPNPDGPDNSSLSLSGLFAYDDLLFPNAGSGQYLDVDGLLFSFDGIELNLYDYLGDGWGDDNGNGGYGTLAIAPTPEPSSWLLLGSGLLVPMLAWMRRSRPSRLLPNA
jgi:hypothetical protein